MICCVPINTPIWRLNQRYYYIVKHNHEVFELGKPLFLKLVILLRTFRLPDLSFLRQFMIKHQIFSQLIYTGLSEGISNTFFSLNRSQILCWCSTWSAFSWPTMDWPRSKASLSTKTVSACFHLISTKGSSSLIVKLIFINLFLTNRTVLRLVFWRLLRDNLELWLSFVRHWLHVHNYY